MTTADDWDHTIPYTVLLSGNSFDKYSYTVVELLNHRWGISISDTGLYGPMLCVFHIFSCSDLSNGKSLMINPQSHSAHYFCHLNEYSAHKVQESHVITLRNYKNTPTVSTYIVKSAK